MEQTVTESMSARKERDKGTLEGSLRVFHQTDEQWHQTYWMRSLSQAGGGLVGAGRPIRMDADTVSSAGRHRAGRAHLTWPVTKREIRVVAMQGAHRPCCNPTAIPKTSSQAMQEAAVVSMAVAGYRQGAGRLIELPVLS